MPLKLSDLTAWQKTVEIDVDGEPLTVTYRPSTITRASIEDVDSAKDFDSLFPFIEAAIVSWDLVGDDDQPLSISRETLGVLPLALLQAIIRGVIQGSRLGEARSGPSGDGSPRRG